MVPYKKYIEHVSKAALKLTKEKKQNEKHHSG